MFEEENRRDIRNEKKSEKYFPTFGEKKKIEKFFATPVVCRDWNVRASCIRVPIVVEGWEEK